MSVIVLTEHTQGVFKKKNFEAVQYAAKVGSMLNVPVVAIAAGDVSAAELENLGAYGATKVLHITDSRLNNLSSKAMSKVVVAAAQKENAKVIIGLHDTTGKVILPRVAARLKAGMVAGATGYPDLGKGFTVKKNVFSGKAYAFVNLLSDIKVISLISNTFPVVKGSGAATVETMEVAFTDADFAIKVKEVTKASGAILLSDAELVVSGGRGLKGPENWWVLEDLAKELGAATACSRPVADSHWRPHNEHVGQTGGTIRPNLYIAVGISGAIQHLAGVNGSKTIVVINKDPEAPFFKAADYGVLGDAMEVVPRLTAAVKKFKENH